MKLIFEKSREGRHCSILSSCDVPEYKLGKEYVRKKELDLPEISENDISRHYTQLIQNVHGVNNGFYPLGSCTMKYNPKINDEAAFLEGFKNIHPLQPEHTIQGCLEVLHLTGEYLCEITGMDTMTFQPAAGAHGEFTGLLLIKAFHEAGGNKKRTKIIIPDSAHGTNPASASMVGYEVVSIPSTKEGYVDLEKLREAAGEDTAGLMLTNPNTLGLFEKDILKITDMIHEAGGLVYYDGANLNPIMGIVRPGDMGFDVVHLNLHKTFSTPHGGGGPGSGPVGCKKFLSEYLPLPKVIKKEKYSFLKENPKSIGSVKAFYGNFLTVVRALTYIISLGNQGIRETAQNAVINANYMMKHLADDYPVVTEEPCMHEFVMSLEKLKKETGVSALDIAKSLLDYGIHPPTMYFPMIVHEALMMEPTETESKETMDEVIKIFRELHKKALSEPEELCKAPVSTPVGRLDEVGAARKPILRYDKGFNEENLYGY